MTRSRSPSMLSSRVIGRSSQSGPLQGVVTLGTIGQMALFVSSLKCQHYYDSGQPSWSTLRPQGETRGRSARQAQVTAGTLERLRDRAFRRLPSRRVRSERAALGFVEEVGFCSTFYRFPDGVACLWEAVVGGANPRRPRRPHHDAGIGLTWAR